MTSGRYSEKTIAAFPDQAVQTLAFPSHNKDSLSLEIHPGRFVTGHVGSPDPVPLSLEFGQCPSQIGNFQQGHPFHRSGGGTAHRIGIPTGGTPPGDNNRVGSKLIRGSEDCSQIPGIRNAVKKDHQGILTGLFSEIGKIPDLCLR